MRTTLVLLVLLSRAVALGVLMLVLMLGPAVVWNVSNVGKVLVVLR